MPLSWVYIISGLKGPQNCQHGRSSGNVFLWTLNEYKTGEKQQSLNPFNPETKPFQSSSRERTQSILLTTAPLPYSVSPVRACGVREPWGCFNLGLCFSWEHEGKWKKTFNLFREETWPSRCSSQGRVKWSCLKPKSLAYKYVCVQKALPHLGQQGGPLAQWTP